MSDVPLQEFSVPNTLHLDLYAGVLNTFMLWLLSVVPSGAVRRMQRGHLILFTM